MATGLLSVLGPWRKLGAVLLLGVASAVAGFQLQQHFFNERSPQQPIAFSHQRHAGAMQIPCQQCHIYAERSTVAGIPPLARCMGCHAVVATDRPEIRKLQDYWQQQTPVPWVRVHDLPDFVYFPHKRHVRAGLACQACHGSIQTMEVLRRENDLTMGWCTDCHREKAVRNGLDCWTCHK